MHELYRAAYVHFQMQILRSAAFRSRAAGQQPQNVILSGAKHLLFLAVRERTGSQYYSRAVQNSSTFDLRRFDWLPTSAVILPHCKDVRGKLSGRAANIEV